MVNYTASASLTQPRSKKENRGTKDVYLILTHIITYRTCYPFFVHGKLTKRLGTVHKELTSQKGSYTSGSPNGPRRYAVGVSFGPSSSTIVHVLQGYAAIAQRNRTAAIEVLAVHVDTDLSRDVTVDSDGDVEKRMALYRKLYPLLTFEVAHLSQVLDVKTVAWETLPLPPAGHGMGTVERLRHMFDSLPSASSRADVRRLLVRHLLLHKAMRNNPPCAALLLGHTATRLAALTLSEVANGRGFSTPWQVNDGPYVVTTYGDNDGGSGGGTADDGGTIVSTTKFHIYYLLRELFETEVRVSASVVEGLKDLVALDDAGGSSAVVSHKDQSIEDVTARYFKTLDSSFTSVVSNVVRTTGKLSRVAGAGAQCGLCGVTLDESGDSRWAGEIGDYDEGRNSQMRRTGLCYGCKRSING